MRRAPTWLLPVSSVLLLFLSACGASTLRRSGDDLADLADLRTEYIARHPDSPYRDHISRGEIVRGMDVQGVVAAWGLPAKRVQDGVDYERWLYVDTADIANEPVGYALSFQKQVLKSWNVQRVGLPMKTRDAIDPLAPPTTDTGRGKSTPTD